MSFDFFYSLQQDNAAVRLLKAANMPMIAGFLHEVFIQKDIQTIPYEKLINELDYYLSEVRAISGDNKYVQTARAYVDEWINDEGFLRKYRDDNSDDAICDLTSQVEKAIRWMESLKDRQFIGTESRLKIVLELLDDLLQGTMEITEDKIVRLESERDQLNQKIMLIKSGSLPEMDDTEIKEKAILLEENVRTLVGDFREVEGNFRRLSKETRLKLVGSDKAKGFVLEKILEDHDNIKQSDEGKSFEGFFELLMRSDLQQKMGVDLRNLLDLAVAKSVINKDSILSGLSSKMLMSAEKIHKTRMQINEQIARFIQESHGKNKRLSDLINDYKSEVKGIDFSDTSDFDSSIRGVGFQFNPVMSLRLFRPDIEKDVVDIVEDTAHEQEIDLMPLLNVTSVDEAVLIDNIQQCLETQSQVSLESVIATFPIRYGLEEALYYLKMAADKIVPAMIDETCNVDIIWNNENKLQSLSMPKIIFTRGLSA